MKEESNFKKYPEEEMLIENVYMALLHRGVKPTERDYIKRGIKTPEDKKLFDQRVKRVESYVRKHPDKLEYVMKRYPKNDPRLSMLNYKMDKMTEASDKYLETQFPTNQDLFTKVKERTKKNMNLTDPKNFKQVKDPIKYVDVEKTKKLKETVTRHFNKPVKSKSMFGLNMNKVRKTNQKMIEKREQEQRVKEEERAYIQEKMENKKSNWKESFTNVTVGMKVGQTFVHNPSGQTVTTAGALGGVETISSTVSIFGDEIPGPDASQYGLQGYAKPMNIMKRKDPEDTNKKLDASQEFAKKVNADVLMNARVSSKTGDLEYKSTDKILADVGDQWTYPEYVDMMNKITIKFSDKAEPLEKIKRDYIKNNKDVPISIVDAIDEIVKAQTAAYDALDKAWERYNKVPDLPDGGDKSSLLDKIASKMKVGTAKNVFDLHLNYLKNPTGKVQNINNLISKKDINALSKTITNNATIDQLKFDVRGLYGVLQNTINQNSGLRNSLGNLDQSKIYLNDSQTEVVIEKPYDFGGFFSGDFVGGDTKSALGAPAYAGLNVLQGKMSVKDFFKGTDTMMIRVKVPIKKKNKKKI